MYHSTPHITVPRALDKAIRFGLFVLRHRSVTVGLKRVQFQSCVRKHEAGQKHTVHRYTESPTEPSQPPVLVAKSRLSVQRAYMAAHKPRYETEHL